MKILVAKHTLISNNYISQTSGVAAASGLTGMQTSSRVTQNIIHDIEGMQGAIFLEAAMDVNIHRP